MRLLALFLLLMMPLAVCAQSIRGVVSSGSAGPLKGVSIENIHSGAKTLTEADGHFSMAVKPGQLVEFHKQGYKTARVRIGGSVAPFYRIILEPGVQALPEVSASSGFKTFQEDSLYYHRLFKKQIEYPVLTGWRAFQSPFTALGKSNQDMIRFQQEYAWIEQQKFIDYAFNEKLVAQLTGLRGDSARAYMERYRPSYEMLRAMPEYDFFSYVKATDEIWRERQRMNRSRSRSAG
jgi:hypothetical protein